MAANPGVIAGGIDPAGIPGTSGTTVTGTTAPLTQGPAAHPAWEFGALQRGIEGPGAPTTGVPKTEKPGHQAALIADGPSGSPMMTPGPTADLREPSSQS